MFIGITVLKQARRLREQAIQCRRLAGASTDRRITDTLNLLAAEYEEKARKTEDEN
jgi:hypothetical protein